MVSGLRDGGRGLQVVGEGEGVGVVLTDREEEELKGEASTFDLYSFGTS